MTEPDGNGPALNASPKGVWSPRIRVWTFALMIAVGIIGIAYVVFELPESALAAGIIACAATALSTFVGVYREELKNELPKTSVRVLQVFTVVFVACAFIICGAVLVQRETHKPPPIKTSMTPLPLDSEAPPNTRDGSSWKLIVPGSVLPDLATISPPAPVGPSCADMWRAAVEAGGQDPAITTFKVQIWGNARATVVDMRARIVRSDIPNSDGTYVGCVPFSMGPPVPDQPVSCDLTQRLDSDQSVACTVLGDEGTPVLMRDEQTIPLRPDAESSGLKVSVRAPPGKAVEWQLQVNVVTPDGDGVSRWFDVGNSVTSSGLRDMEVQPYQRYIMSIEGVATLVWAKGDPGGPPKPSTQQPNPPTASPPP